MTPKEETPTDILGRRSGFVSRNYRNSRNRQLYSQVGLIHSVQGSPTVMQNAIDSFDKPLSTAVEATRFPGVSYSLENQWGTSATSPWSTLSVLPIPSGWDTLKCPHLRRSNCAVRLFGHRAILLVEVKRKAKGLHPFGEPLANVASERGAV
jgi:hypothetical protein